MNSSSNRATNQAGFTEKEFASLIDEEKREFVRHRLVQTLLGGYRTLWRDEESIPWHLHLLQFLIFLLIPGISIMAVKAFNEDRNLAVILGAVIPFAINTPL